MAWLESQLVGAAGAGVLLVAPSSWAKPLVPVLPEGTAVFDPARPLVELPAGRYALGIVAGALPSPPGTGDRALLARLRDERCERVVVIAAAGADPGRQEMLALGFSAPAEAPSGVALYEYDIASYNPEREWNNPSDWAHPQNFNRYRW